MHDDEDRQTPHVLTAAVAAGTVPLPLLAVYATMFIVHGGFHHVSPPEVTDSNGGELLVGLLCLALLGFGVLAIVWTLNSVRRWTFLLLQAVFLAISIDFVLDSTKGGPLVSGLVVVTSAVALVLGVHPDVSAYFGQRCPAPLALVFGRRPAPRAAMPAGSMQTAADRPSSARVLGRRRASR